MTLRVNGLLSMLRSRFSIPKVKMVYHRDAGNTEVMMFSISKISEPVVGEIRADGPHSLA